MEFKKPGGSGDVLKQLIAPLAVLAVEKILESKAVKPSVDRFDKRAAKKVESVARNARRNRGLLAGSAAAFAVAVGLLVQSGRKR